MSNSNSKWLISFICLIAGMSLTELYHFIYINPYFTIEDKINIIDLFTLIATIFLAWYIPAVLAKKGENTRIEKSIIIAKIEKSTVEIEEFINIIRAGSINYTEAASKMRSISLSITKISSYSKKLQIQVDRIISDINSELGQLNKLVTGTLTTAELDAYAIQNKIPPLTVSKNIVTFSKSRVTEIIKCETVLESKLFDLIVLINREDIE